VTTSQRRFPAAPAAPLDPPAWVDGIEGPLAKFVFGYVRDRHAAEDLVQETFLRVIRNLDRFRGHSSMRTWIFSIARNLCLDYLKASGRSRLKLVESLDSTEHDQSVLRKAVPDSLRSDPGRRVELDESRARVGRALAGLSPEAKDLLILRAYLGLSYREIALRCKVAPAGVGTRLSRALQGLSTALQSAAARRAGPARRLG
jgi:RNA polymerase sigma-70 factor (ECF subfamily)